MLKQPPMLDITSSKRYQVRAQVDKVKFHFFQSARDIIADLQDLYHMEYDPEHLEFIDSHLGDNKYPFPVAECIDSGVCSPNPEQRELKAANEWPASTLLPGSRNPAIYLDQILSLGEYPLLIADRFDNSMIDGKEGHRPSLLIMFPFTALRHALLEWQKNKSVFPKASMSKLKVNRPDRWNYFKFKNNGGKNSSCCVAMVHKLLTSPGIADTDRFLMNTWNTLPQSYQLRVYKDSLATAELRMQQAENWMPELEMFELGTSKVDGYEGEAGDDADADEEEDALQADDGSTQNVEGWGHSRFNLGTSDVNGYEGEDGNYVDMDEEEEASEVDDGWTPNVENWGYSTRECEIGQYISDL